jgi:hypothetical protein
MATLTTSFNFTTGKKPERYIVEYDSTIVIDTFYVGSAVYDFGGTLRSDFVNSFITDNIPELYDLPIAPDGYPFVFSTTTGTLTFNNDILLDEAIVRVYSPLADPNWEFTMGCPVYQT